MDDELSIMWKYRVDIIKRKICIEIMKKKLSFLKPTVGDVIIF